MSAERMTEQCWASVIVHDERGSFTNHCQLPPHHEGSHEHPMTACEPVARMCWDDDTTPAGDQ